MLLSLTAFSLNSEHIVLETNTQHWETGRIIIIFPILQQAKVQRTSVFLPLVGWVSAGHRKECQLWGKGGVTGHHPPNQGGLDDWLLPDV